MTRSCIISFACFTLTVLVAHPAAASPELAKEKDCLVCHSIDKKLIGPAYKEVAAKYAGSKGIEDKLTKKVLMGGSGAWGSMPMPANIQVTEDEARTLVKWVLKLNESVAANPRKIEGSSGASGETGSEFVAAAK